MIFIEFADLVVGCSGEKMEIRWELTEMKSLTVNSTMEVTAGLFREGPGLT